MGNIIVVDNRDSFTFNLVDMIESLGHQVSVLRNTVTPEELLKRSPQALVLSPGPFSPERAGNLVSICKRCAPEIPTLGICLGHQAITLAFGGELGKLLEPVQGYKSDIVHNGQGAFENVPCPISMGRYHALYTAKVPPEFMVTAYNAQDQIVMGIRHHKKPIEGFQFHPESILSFPYGKMILKKWLSHAGLT